MSKNVLLLAMSVLPKEVRPNTYINFTEERVAAETNDGGEESTQIIEARGQLEPVAKMLISYFRENGQRLDKIIVLATKETLEAKKVLFIEDREGKEEKTEREICAVDFFKEQINDYIGEDAGQEELFKIVHIDIDRQSQGIQHIIRYLRKLKAESGKIPLNLYVDTHGGLRSIQMTINALLFLLKNEAIYPQKIYTVVFRQGGEKRNQIRYERDFEIYDLVSGINEFVNYGRSKSLCSYVAAIEGSEEEKKAAVKLADIIQKISNAIQLCDMQRFEQALEELAEFVKSKPMPADSYLNLFVNSIKDDYGILLKKRRSVSDILSWCIRKEFYQQALTLIESRMPKELMEHKIISVNDKAEAFVKKNRGYYTKENYIINRCAYEILEYFNYVKKNTLRCKGKDVIKELRACFNEMKSEEGKGRVYEIFEEKIKEIKASGLKCLNYKTKAEEMVLFFNIPTDVENEIWLKLILFFALHQLLKDQRNIVNHSLTRGGRIQVKHLPELVNRYIDMYSELISRVK